MDQEMANLKSYNVYEPMLRTNGMRTLKLGWVFHRKFKNGVLVIYNKGRLVAQGNQHHHGIDYGDSFSPVMHLESLRTILALAATRDLDIIRFDIISAYLHGTLKEEVYMEEPVALREKDCVWRLKKRLYRPEERAMRD